MTAIPERNPEIAWRDEPGEREKILAAQERGEDVADQSWVLLVDGGEMVNLNLVAGEIWCLADGTRTAGEIAEELAARYEATPDEILGDVEAFLSDCADRGWIVWKEFN